MSKNKKIAWSLITGVAILAILTAYLRGQSIDTLQPAGPIASQERSLMITATLLGMIVIVPVFVLTIWIAWKYRESNHRSKKYSPNWDHGPVLEAVWWGIPLAIITILSVITWHSSYALDPFRPLNTSAKPLTIQVVSLDWKWLFLYPEQHVASVNQVHFPANRPVNFEITSDTVMNSFWLPRLSGQIYAMPGMSTELHLMADKEGSYNGSSANISGSGFAGMAFKAQVESQADFDKWTTSTTKTAPALTLNSYNQLAKPSKNNPVSYYSMSTKGLYEYTVMKYMAHGAEQ